MKKKKSPIKILSLTLIVLSVTVLVATLGVCAYAHTNIDYSLDEQLLINAKGGNTTKFYYDASYGRGDYTPKELCRSTRLKSKNWYRYSEIGDNLKSAFIAVEDRNFFNHHGVDLKRTCFAAFNYLFHVKSKFGASTITQQLIKNISGDNEQTLSRKFSEILRAAHIERNHTKEEIFEAYLNVIPMGNGIFGVGLAAEQYFGKKPDALSYAEVATLVGITNAPGRYNPRTNPDLCEEKRNIVLRTMYECGVIDDEEYRIAKETELEIAETSYELTDIDSWFIETVIDDISSDLAKSKNISESAARIMLMNGGYSVYTTVNPEIQGILERYFENTDNFPEAVYGGLQYSMVILDPDNGNLLGIVGGVGKKQANRILNYALTPITPGSSLKPLALYAPALDKKYVNWATVFDDVPVEFKRTSDGTYIEYPRNYPKVYDGLITLGDALRLSKNTVAIRLYNLLGKENIYRSLKNDFGFNIVDIKTLPSGAKITDKAPSPLALGQLTYGIPLRQLTGAYTVFTRDGEFSTPKSYISVYDSKGELILENKSYSRRVFSKETARIMNQLLMLVTENGTAKSVTLGNIVDTAGKTGTSGNDKDKVFVGYTPYCVAGIWCGYSGREKSIGSQSVTHLDVWDDIMQEIHEVLLVKEERIKCFSCNGLLRLPFCKDSGKMFSESCLYDPRGSRLDYGFFTSNNKPGNICATHVLCFYDELTGEFVTDHSHGGRLKPISLLNIPNRSFPKDIFVTDSEYVYRDPQEGATINPVHAITHFMCTSSNDEYMLDSKEKRNKASCYLHA